jgi:hypothetical protein
MQRFQSPFTIWLRKPGLRFRRTWGLALRLIFLFGSTNCLALEHVVIERDGQRQEITGELVVTAEDGGQLIRAGDGVLWTIQPEEMLSRRSDSMPFQPFDRDKMIESLRLELPGFEFHTTSHFIIVYNTTEAYAEWCGGLHERLYNGFFNYWKRQGAELADPPGPLVAIVFADQASYASYASDELGTAAKSIVGYYSLRSNRVVTYDLTGSQQIRTANPRPKVALQINQLLAQPAAAPTVATIVHEATHQLAYNSGLQRRYADNPLWLSEGLAMYFETPDLKSSRGWRGIGNVNRNRLNQVRIYQQTRPSDSLQTLLATDDRVRDGETAINAYAESWALCHFLLKRYPDRFVDYLAEQAKKNPLVYDTPQQRLLEFQRHFRSITALDAEFQRFIEKLR